jgi:hypothetical protein
MAHPDHDQVIGSLVAARLRGAAARDTARIEPCPDGETWAAYVDGGLLPAEAGQLEAHLATCPTCRRLVAALVPEGTALETPAEVPAALGGAVVLPFPRRQVWTWMAAAAGVLGAVTLWSVSRLDQRSDVPLPDASPAMAMREAAPPPSATAPAGGAAPVTQPAPPARDRDRRLATTETAKAAAPAEERFRRANAPPSSDASKAAAPVAPATGREGQDQAKPAEAKRADAHRQQVNVQVNVARPHGPLAADQQAANQNAANQAPSQAAAPPPAAPATTAAPTPAPAPPPPPPAVADAAAGGRFAGLTGARSARAAAAPANERKEEKDKADAAAAAGVLETVTMTGPVMPAFAEPDGRLRWRIADNGRRIESSSDGGTTWNGRYTAKRGERLRAGSAPDIDNAWVVGDRGLVLRRAVPGDWHAVTRLETLALVAVSASGADTARVTAADGRVFETRDGGATWTPVGAGANPR